jgi:hypothetical protein
MALPAELTRYAREPGIRTYARILKVIQKDLAKLASQVISVEVLAKADQRSGFRKFFALEKATDADHWLAVNAVVLQHEVRILAPFRRGLPLPYSVEISLSAPLGVTASYRKGLVRRPEWVVEPAIEEHRGKAKELAELALPDVGWRHDSGGIPILLSEGGKLGMSVGATRRATWTVTSAYQGFLFGVGPRVGKYVRAVDRLEALLQRWVLEAATPKPKPAPQPRSAPKPSGAATQKEADAALSSLERAAEELMQGGSKSDDS